jgi:hypothetical protein
MDSTDTNPVLVELIMEGLYHWFNQTSYPPTSPSTPYEDLVTSQSNIGWDQLLLGRWSFHWVSHQSSYLHRTNTPHTHSNNGTKWLSAIIKLIWTHCRDEWLVRNAVLHGNTQQSKHQARLHRAQFRIRSLYELRRLCSPITRARWFYPTVEIHFDREKTPHQLENWISLNEARIHTQAAYRQLHQRTGQRSIHDYFPPIT